MKAVLFDKPGDPDVMYISECDVPKISKTEVLIKVKFAGVNRPDIIQREGNYPAPFKHSKILGLEVSGEIIEIGSKVKTLKKGDLVAALVNGGGYAEYCASDQKTVFKIPNNLSIKEAATIPECYMTVWSNLIMRGKLKKKQRALVHGGSSGIGIAAIQILKLFQSEIFTTVGNQEKEKFCKSLGVKHVFNYKDQDFYTEINNLNKKLDIILDYIGGEYISKNIDLLGNEGKLINIGFQNGSKVNLNLIKIMLKRLVLTGSTLRIRNSAFKGRIINELKKYVFPSFVDGSIKCFIDSTFDLKDVALSHKRLDEGNHIGKVVLKI